MSCADVRLDEYFDGELEGADRAAVEAHLSACADCRSDLERSRRLEDVLRSVPAGAAPDADRFVQSVRLRSRPSPFRGWGLAAAGLLAASALYWGLSTPAAKSEDFALLVEAYSEKPSESIEHALKAGGPDALRTLESLFNTTTGKKQFVAATLLFKLADGPTRDRVLAGYQQKREPSSGWTLGEPGTEDEDSELVPIAVSLAVNGQDSRALTVLQKLNRLDRAAQRKIVDSVVTLLHSTSVDVQRHALEIVKKLDIEFPLPALVELLDSPELGDEALRFLRKETQKDFGRDKQAWLKALGR